MAAAGVVVAGLAAVLSAAWCGPLWKAGWGVAALGLVLVLLAWGRRLRALPGDTGPARTTVRGGRVFALMFCAAAALLTLSATAWVRGYQLQHSATARVTALVDSCSTPSEGEGSCEYRYTFDGRAYDVTATGSSEDPSRCPTSTEVIRMAPAHPGDLGRSDNSYQVLWVGIILCALPEAVRPRSASGRACPRRPDRLAGGFVFLVVLGLLTHCRAR